MSTPSTEVHTAHPNFCGDCGTRLGEGRFCPGCGHDVTAPAEAARANGDTQILPPAPPPPAAPNLGAAPPAPRASRTRPMLAGIAVLVLVAGIAAVLVTTRSGGDGEQTAYSKRVAEAFGPVLGANQELSDELSRLRGTNPTDARASVRRAQQATTRTEGALAALNVPEGSEQLAADARQVLDRETAYLNAVAAVLANPSSPNRGQLDTLASNLSSALSQAGPSVAGEEPTVSGADRLTAWAPRAARTLKRRAAAKNNAREAAGGTAAAPPASTPYADGRSCGAGLYAGPNTSCEFAANVRRAYNEAPGITASVRAYSPATGQTYTMNCAPSGDGITCSGGNSASVTF